MAPVKRVGLKKRFFVREELLQWIESTSKEKPVKPQRSTASSETGNNNGAIS
jgi:hypothetical protein